MNGTICRVVGDKGFGFIRGEDKKEYFFHRTDIDTDFNDLIVEYETGRPLNVEFESVPSPKGPRAGSVQMIEN